MSNHWRVILSVLFNSLVIFHVNGQDFSTYEHHYYRGKMDLPFRLLRPLQSDSTKRSYPLIIFLHGAAQKGSDNESQLLIGGSYFLQDNIRNNYPAFVLFPQCPRGDLWAAFETSEDSFAHKLQIKFPFRKTPTDVSATLISLIDSISKTGQIDSTRIYIGGLSQGAMGVMDLIARYPDLFAAAISICGAGKTNTAERFAGKVALWLFHGEKDEVIPASFSRDYFKRLQKLNADVRFSEYRSTGHDSWTHAFNETTLLQWLFSKAKVKQ